MCMSLASWFCCAMVREANLVWTSSRGSRGVGDSSSTSMRLACFLLIGQWHAICPSCLQWKQVMLLWASVTTWILGCAASFGWPIMLWTSCVDLVLSMVHSLMAWYPWAKGGLRMPSSVDLSSQLRNNCVVSGFPLVYPACLAKSSNWEMYLSVTEWTRDTYYMGMTNISK